MNTYVIDYGTGVKEIVIGTLEDAKRAADEGASYTQMSIMILDKEEKMVAVRKWYGVEFNPDLFEDGKYADVICFGDFGYFDEWSEYEH